MSAQSHRPEKQERLITLRPIVAHLSHAPTTRLRVQRIMFLPPNAIHAKDIQPHARPAPPNTGTPKQDQKYQQQQQKLYAQQEQDHQKLAQKQEQDHQRLTQQKANEARTQQVEQKHTQQTQQMEQKHTQQQQKLQTKQQPATRNESRPPK